MPIALRGEISSRQIVSACLAVLVCATLARAAAPAPDEASPGLVAVLLFGLVLGIKHAIEPDHVAAVTAIVSERRSVLGSALVGTLWGVGHTLTLFAAAIAVILLRLQIGEKTALRLEFAVACMLVVLGANVLRKLFRRGGPIDPRAHGVGTHDDTHAHGIKYGSARDADPSSASLFRFDLRPLVVGAIHGMAGSAALMLLVLSTTPSALAGLLYVLIFGAGSIGGMAAMSVVISLPARLAADRFAGAEFIVRLLAGAFSLGLGALLIYEIGFVEGALRS